MRRKDGAPFCDGLEIACRQEGAIGCGGGGQKRAWFGSGSRIDSGKAFALRLIVNGERCELFGGRSDQFGESVLFLHGIEDMGDEVFVFVVPESRNDAQRIQRRLNAVGLIEGFQVGLPLSQTASNIGARPCRDIVRICVCKDSDGMRGGMEPIGKIVQIDGPDLLPEIASFLCYDRESDEIVFRDRPAIGFRIDIGDVAEECVRFRVDCQVAD